MLLPPFNEVAEKTEPFYLRMIRARFDEIKTLTPENTINVDVYLLLRGHDSVIGHCIFTFLKLSVDLLGKGSDTSFQHT